MARPPALLPFAGAVRLAPDGEPWLRGALALCGGLGRTLLRVVFVLVVRGFAAMRRSL